MPMNENIAAGPIEGPGRMENKTVNPPPTVNPPGDYLRLAEELEQ